MVSGGNLPPLTPSQGLTRRPGLLCNVRGPFDPIVHPSITVSPSIRVRGVWQNVPAKFAGGCSLVNQGHQVITGPHAERGKVEPGGSSDSGGNWKAKFLFEEEKLHRWPRCRFVCTFQRASLLFFQTKPGLIRSNSHCKVEFELKTLRYWEHSLR